MMTGEKELKNEDIYLGIVDEFNDVQHRLRNSDELDPGEFDRLEAIILGINEFIEMIRTAFDGSKWEAPEDKKDLLAKWKKALVFFGWDEDYEPSSVEITKRFRELAKKYHPDKISDPDKKEEAKILFQELNDDYNFLKLVNSGGVTI